MNILAIDTTGQTLSSAIFSDGKCLAEFSLFIEGTHTSRLMPLIDALLKSTNMSISDIDYFACTVGPGSFTGLRIGISTVKGLAYANGKKVVAVSSLDALTENIPHSSYDVCPLIDARKGEVFAAFYNKEKGVESISKTDEINITPDELIKLVQRKTLFLGSGAVLYKEMLTSKLNDKAIFATDELNYIKGRNVAKLAIELIKKRRAIKPDNLVPVYIRKPDIKS